MKTKMSRLTKNIRLIIASSAAVGTISAFPAFAQETENTESIIVTGTRMTDRSAADSPVPVDIISGEDFRQNSSADVQDLLRTAVPSFNINSQPISDAATIVRPANLRGLSPDHVLVLVNGKRRHRGSIISFLGGGISDGAQGVDISAIPSMALKQVEVLRDGASSQYGSDAIAGVLNFILKDDSEGFEVVTRYGSTYEGDGNNYTIAANAGLPLGDSGFINLTAEIRDVEGTLRSVVRGDSQGMIDAGYLPAADFQTINSYTSDYSQYWGQPDVEDDVKLFINSAFEINDQAEVYLFGNYGERAVTGGFFYRNPLTEGKQRGGVYRGPNVDPLTGNTLPDLFNPESGKMDLPDPAGVHSVLVGDLDGLDNGGSCINGIPIGGAGNVTPDAGFLGQVTSDDNCFSFIETIPGGFVPRFGGTNEDQSIAVGVRGEVNVGSGLRYDLSAQQGSNRTDFYIRNTINASMGPDTPRDFVPGGQEQTETQFNLDLVYDLDVGFDSDLSIAFGAEYREEEFDLFAGDAASYELGVLASQGFSSSSNGFGGFPASFTSSQDSTAFYVDVEADITEQLTLQAAVRAEDFSEFGNTTDFKVAGIYHVTDDIRIRGAISTGFHAPTAGQANITNVTTQNVQGVLVDQGTLPLSSAAGQLGANFIDSQGNGRPELGPEDAKNFSIGVGFNIADTTWTIDYYNIELTNRVALGANVDFLDALNFADSTGANYGSVSAALTGLDAQGVIDRNNFIGLDDLAEFRFFSNSFDTTTTGIDVVGNINFEFMGGDSGITIAANYNKTEVDSLGTVNPIGTGRVAALEDLLPNIRGNVSWNHTQGDYRTLLRASYYGGWDDTGNGVTGIGAEVLIDIQVAYQFSDQLEFVAGVDNLLDTYPQENPGALGSGQLYSESSPFGFNGGTWYLQARFTY